MMIFPVIAGLRERLFHIKGMLHADNLALVIDFIVALTGILSQI